MNLRKFDIKIAANATLLLILLAVMTGLIYPLVVSGIAALFFPEKSKGSMVKVNGRVVGSELIGQSFDGSPFYFKGRPSAAGDGYDAASSRASNLGPANKELYRNIEDRLKNIREENGLGPDAEIPCELVTSSASGLDPHISPDGAYIQVSRIAKARGVKTGEVRKIVKDNIEPRPLGIFGEPKVNVLLINIELDSRLGRPGAIEGNNVKQ